MKKERELYTRINPQTIDMKTPQQILNDYFFSFKDGHKEKIVSAMKEYAKQWVEEAAWVAMHQCEHGYPVADAVLKLNEIIDAQ